ncbi:MAG: glycine cleavage system aminomethyltransferase GcvT [Firmicutes bacterium]|nr:glycine cleavage system aminomethyltransferase GcvT [Bacillota bacterium]
MAEELKRTPLYAAHQRLGARMVPFGGWEMPVQYSGILAEHHAVRTAVGLFDVSHMGELEFRGPEALAALQRLVTNDVSRLEVGQALYSPMCNDRGTVVDDVLVYRLGPDHYWMVVNAANTEKDFAWVRAQLQDRLGPELEVRNISDQVAQVALQGPLAQEVLQPLTDFPLATLGSFRAVTGARVGPVETLVLSRTGYTGEDGFEIYCRPEDAETLWNLLLGVREPAPVVPCGLGARDTLRFEACLPLYGHELDETVTPLEAGLGAFVKLQKGDFIGREALARQKEAGVTRKLVGLELLDRGGIPRQGYEVVHQGEVVGRVTSGAQSPTLGKVLALAYVPVALSQPGTELAVVIRARPLRAVVVPRPFYRRQTPAKGPAV